MIPAELDRLVAGLADSEALGLLLAGRPADVGRPGPRRLASVLALFSSDAPGLAGLRLVAVEKTAHLRNHAGQVAFPGGRREPGESARAAALRETEEEVGVRAEDVSVLGCLPEAGVSVSGFNVTTVVGWWATPRPLVPVDVGEVGAVHQLRVAELIDPANRATWVHPSGFSGPVFLVDDLFIWGLTGHLISALLDLASWTVAWDASRTLEIPPRFLRERAGSGHD